MHMHVEILSCDRHAMHNRQLRTVLGRPESPEYSTGPGAPGPGAPSPANVATYKLAIIPKGLGCKMRLWHACREWTLMPGLGCACLAQIKACICTTILSLFRRMLHCHMDTVAQPRGSGGSIVQIEIWHPLTSIPACLIQTSNPIPGV